MSTPASESSTLKLSLELYPGLSRFALDVVRGDSKAARYCRRIPLESIRPSGSPRGRDDLVAALATSNRTWSNDVEQPLARWNRGESLALIAGQQVGLGGGPIYTLAKIASLLSLRKTFESRGVPATVFFWMATEDHDYDEAASFHLLSGGKVRTLPIDNHVRGSSPVGQRQISEKLRAPLLALLQEVCRDSGITGQNWLEPGLTFRDSFARLLTIVFRGQGLVLVDSLLPELRREGKSLFLNILRNHDRIQNLLAERSEGLEKGGYAPQIQPNGGEYTLLYVLGEKGERLRITHLNGEWSVGPRKSSFEELVRRVEESPELVSTAAATRPLLQDQVFAPEVFIGGPSEVAYYAQVSVLHEELSIRQPHVGLRGHVLLIPARTLATVERFGLEAADVFLPADEILSAGEAGAVRELERTIGEIDQQMREQLGRLGELVETRDRTLQRSIERSLRRIGYHVGRITDRGRRTIARRNEERYRAIERFCSTIMPNGAPQDRSIAWLPFWLQYGDRLVSRVLEEIKPDSDELMLVGL